MNFTPMKRISTLLLCLLTLQVWAQSDSKKYLLVLDIQNHFTSSIFPKDEERTSFIETINSVIANTNPANVIYVESISAQLSLTLKGPKVIFPYDLHLDERLRKVNRNFIVKNRPNVFSEEDMIDFATKNNATDFVIIGLAAEHCVLQSALGGQKRGYNITVIPEAVAGTTPEDKQKALKEIREMGISIVHIDEFL